MNHVNSAPGGLLYFLVILATACFGANNEKPVVTGKWGRFEQSFKSSVSYTSPVQEANLTVVFQGPAEQMSEVSGFWDGETTWRVRFSPSHVGRWMFRTKCSDPTNKGLHNQTGTFTCTPATGNSRFDQHGPIRVSSDHRHFEHADGTPFFWLADTVWNGPRVSEPKNWEFYAFIRASQQFTAVQWAVAPGQDANGEYAITGSMHRLDVNPAFFRRLEAKMDILTRLGILNVIVPLLEIGSHKELGTTLSDEQAALFTRYLAARWGADPIAWLFAFETDTRARKVARWKKIGQTTFDRGAQAPVILYPGETTWVLDEFRNESWVDAFGYRNVTGVSEDALKLAVAGPFSKEWKTQPERPMIIFSPHENELSPQSSKRVSCEDVRRAIFWGLLQAPPAGVSYGAQGVAQWDTKKQSQEPGDLPIWKKSLFLPGAKQMGHASKFMNSIDFWKLRPQPQFLAAQPGDAAPGRYIAASGLSNKALTLVYVPEDRQLELFSEVLPLAPTITWLNPRTGESSEAVAILGRTCQIPTPDPGDWLLIVRGK